MKTPQRFLGIVSTLILLSGCIPTSTDNTAESSSSVSSSRTSFASSRSSLNSVMAVSSMASSVSSTQAAAPRVVTVTVANWEFSPSVIRIKKGEQVTLHLVGQAGNHGFAVPGLGINVQVAGGGATDVEIATGTAGTYTFFCSVPCGEGHKEMKGTIIIE